MDEQPYGEKEEEINLSDENGFPEINPLAESAVALHEMFLALMSGGFSERQAVLIIVEFVRGNS